MVSTVERGRRSGFRGKPSGFGGVGDGASAGTAVRTSTSSLMDSEQQYAYRPNPIREPVVPSSVTQLVAAGVSLGPLNRGKVRYA